jgi:rhodanese-related sulfurtransferase
VTDSDRSPAIDVLEADRRLREADRGGSGEQSNVGPILLDVREPAEFDMVRAEGARLLPLSAFLARYQSLPVDRPLMVICATGSRSGQATAYLLAHGWSDVVNVTGGTAAWQRAGLPIRSGPLAPGEGDLGF